MNNDPAVSRELAARDMADIKALEETPAFERYFMRRLKQRREQLNTSFLTQPMTHEDREVHRRLVLEYDDLLGMMKRDQLGAQRTSQ